LKKVTIFVLVLIIITIFTTTIVLADPGRGTQRPYRSGASIQIPFPLSQAVEVGQGTRAAFLDVVLDFFFGEGHNPELFSIMIWDLEPTGQTGDDYLEGLLPTGVGGYTVVNTDSSSPDPVGINLIMVCLGYGSATNTLTTSQQTLLQNFNNGGQFTTKTGGLYAEGTDFAENHPGTELLITNFETNYNATGGQTVGGVVGVLNSVGEGFRFGLSSNVNADIDDTIPSSQAGPFHYPIFINETPVEDWMMY
jgi:hypothetical protein